MADSKKAKAENKSGFFRSFILAIIIGLSGAILISGNLLFWAGETVVNNNQFTKTTAPLIKNHDIQVAIAKYGTNQLFSNVNVQGYISSVLPKKASFLAPTLASQLKTVVNQTLEKTLAKPKVQDIWNNSLQKTHAIIVKGAINYKGNGQLNLGQLFSFIGSNLKGTKLSFLSDKQLPSNIGQIQIINASWLPTIHKIAVNIKPFEAIMTLLLVILICLAIIIARQKQKIILKMSLLFSFLMLLTIISLRIIRLGIQSQVNSDYSSAAVSAYQIVMRPFYIQTATLMILFLIIGLIAWLTGKSKLATKFKKSVSKIFSGNLHSLLFKKENKVTKFFSFYQKYLNWGIIILLGILLCVISISLYSIIGLSLIALIFILIVDILAVKK